LFFYKIIGAFKKNVPVIFINWWLFKIENFEIKVVLISEFNKLVLIFLKLEMNHFVKNFQFISKILNF
jgi:hypothetical protein